ncbi:MAG TPA: FAD-dependent monooxygenase [Acidimicrobiia bacterium]|nr:FAD-dependent monooxygenase [Acidimicrobiia bacterium]
MKIGVVGAGPSGLYFSVLMARTGNHEVTVFERNARGATYGWGVVFSEGTLAELAEVDYLTYLELERSLVRWSAIDIRHSNSTIRSYGHGFSAISRHTLLRVLEDRAHELGVMVNFETEISGPDLSSGDPGFGLDLVVAADGVNSGLRRHHQRAFGPSLHEHPTRYIWLGAPFAFDAFTFVFAPTPAGLFQAHAYPYDADGSTFIVETTEETWQRSGMSDASEDESVGFCSKLFADHLEGNSLRSNRSLWNRFVTLRNRHWFWSESGGTPVVLLGDAAHTAHFSIGSGTKLAMEDAAALYQALNAHPENVRLALAEYEAERQPAVARFQEAARESARYFEFVGHHLQLDPVTFAFNLLTRSGRVTHFDMERRDPSLTIAADRVVAGIVAGEVVPPPSLTAIDIGGLDLPNRLVADFDDAGGAGLLLTPTIAVDDVGRSHPGSPVAGPAARRYTTESGRAVGVVIGHAGARASTRPPEDGLDRPLREGGWEPIACSPIAYSSAHRVPRSLSASDMAGVVAAFEAAAAWARAAGFSLLVVDAARGGLLAGFLSPVTNHRSDRFGGDVAARSRFPLEVFRTVKEKWNGPVGVRLSVTDWIRGGTSLEDAIAIAAGFAGAGAAVVEIVGGGTVAEAEPAYRRGYLISFAAEVRQRAGVAVLVGGGITSRDEADTAIAAGRADLIRMDPYLYRRPLIR